VATNNAVSVLLGNGDGTFQAARTFAAGSGPRSVAVADVNADGLPDLIVANYGFTGSVSVLLGNGDGTFQAPRTFAAGPWARSVAVGDFNGDGRLDLAVANYMGDYDTVSVLLGNGDGTFQAPRSFAVGRGARSVAVADVNGDGLPDLVVANALSNDVSVLLGNGDGTFQIARNFPAGIGPQSVAVADVNGDGRLDLTVAYAGSFPDDYNGGVSVLLGNGDGSFQAARSFAAGRFPQSMAVADINGDGRLDVAVAGSGGVRVLPGNGDGTFQTTYISYIAIGSPSLVAGDFNGDGWPDLATTGVSILLNDGNWPNRPHGPSRRPPGSGPSARLLSAAVHTEVFLAPLFSAGASRTFPTVEGELDARTAAALLGREVARTSVDLFFASPSRPESWPVARRPLQESAARDQGSWLDILLENGISPARLAMIPGLAYWGGNSALLP
jgi:hypothetical protein